MELYYITYLCTAALVFAFLVSCNNCYSIPPDYLYTKEREKARLATEPCTRRLALHALLILGLAGRCVLHLFTQKNETCFDDFTLHSFLFFHSFHYNKMYLLYVRVQQIQTNYFITVVQLNRTVTTVILVMKLLRYNFNINSITIIEVYYILVFTVYIYSDDVL